MWYQVVQVEFDFSEAQNVLGKDQEELVQELVASWMHALSLMHKPVCFWQSDSVYTVIGYTSSKDIFDTSNSTQWTDRATSALHAIGCRVQLQRVGRDWSVSAEVVQSNVEYLILLARENCSPLSDQTGVPYDFQSLRMDEEKRDSLYRWLAIYDNLDSIYLSDSELAGAAYKQLSEPSSELSQVGLALSGSIELLSGIPTYYFLLRSENDFAPEVRRKCPQCDKKWQESDQPSVGFWNFEFRCHTCRLITSWPR